MSLTEEQRNNIYHLDSETQIEILHECVEALGIVDVPTYEKVMNERRRTIYDKIDKGKIKTLDIGIHKFPMINH
jgi:hypothetical protein